MKPQKFEPLRTDHLPLRTDTYYETRDENWVLLGHNFALSTDYPFVVTRSSSEKHIGLSYTAKGEHLRGCLTGKDIIGMPRAASNTPPKVTTPLPKLGRPKGSPVSAAAMAARADNWTLHTLRAMYANAINIRDKDKDLLSHCVIDELGTAINKLVFKLHPELERLIDPDDVIISNHREWTRDKNWVWYSVPVPKEVKINCL